MPSCNVEPLLVILKVKGSPLFKAQKGISSLLQRTDSRKPIHMQANHA
jgi:hypothetical protein